MLDIQSAVVQATLIKLGIAALLGGVVGFERELHSRPAGMRTHIMLILGVTLFSEVSKVFPGSDQSRIAAQIITGVGFLGAGTIMRLGAEVKGLTSAASLFTVAAIGMSVSVGGSFMTVAVVTTIIAVIVLSLLDNIERKLVPSAHPRAIALTLADPSALAQVIQSLEAANGRVKGVRFIGQRGTNAQLDVQGDHAKLLSVVISCPGVTEASWEN